MPWANDVAGIVLLGLAGQEAGTAIADMLFGKVSPSGHLPFTLPLRYEDNPTYPFYPGGSQADYGEGLFVGYRFYDKVHRGVLFPFGHGLSYADFNLNDIALRLPNQVQVSVSNTSRVSAAAVVQIYCEGPSVPEASPVRKLVGYAKIPLDGYQSKSVTLDLEKRAFDWFNPDANRWEPVVGKHVLIAGWSSRDLGPQTSVTVQANGLLAAVDA